jgi:hypothetical protein
VVQLLLKHKANPNLICNGFSPLALAIASGNDSVSFAIALLDCILLPLTDTTTPLKASQN